jgi:hypothetical protein
MPRSFLILAFLVFLALPLNAMMKNSHSLVFSSTKAVNDFVREDDSFLYRFEAESSVRSFIGEMSFVKRVWGHYSLWAEIKSALDKGQKDYHGFELAATRGFTDGKIYGLLSVGYRMAHYSKREQWLVFSTGTGFIPAPYGLETSIAYYQPLTSERYARLRAEFYGLYRVPSGGRYLDLGLQTSFYIIPSGEFGKDADPTGYTYDNRLIEEFMQIEGGIVVRYSFQENFILKLVVTNVLFINQYAYEEDPTLEVKRGSRMSYAPKASAGIIFKF